MTNPRAANEDLTAKARIRNAALDLYSQYGGNHQRNEAPEHR